MQRKGKVFEITNFIREGGVIVTCFMLGKVVWRLLRYAHNDTALC